MDDEILGMNKSDFLKQKKFPELRKNIISYRNNMFEEGRLQGAKDLLKEIKCIYKGFVDVREADEYVLDFIKRQIKKELK